MPLMDETAQAAPEERDAGGGSRWGTVAWLVCSLLLVGLVVGIWFRVGASSAGANLANAIIAGDRPAAPALPQTQIRDDGAPGLPAWYRVTAEGEQDPAGAGGKVLVVNWWASWCGPCEEEAPALKEIADDYADDVTIVGLNAGSQDLESDARAFIRRHELDFTIVRGNRSDEDAWGVSGFPETYVVGTDGRISSFVNGPIDEETLRGLLDAELAEDRT